jgi:hypothetical protein
MAVLFLLLTLLGAVVVGDLVWENTAAGEVTVFDQPIAGYTEGGLLAMAATLGFAVALLLVASVHSTEARRARRRQLRTLRRAMRRRAAEPERDDATLDELLDRGAVAGKPRRSARPLRERREDQLDASHASARPQVTEHHPESQE